MCKSPRIRPNSGMTVTEVVVAMAVIALASMLLISCFSSAMAMLVRGIDRQTASDMAYAGVQAASAQRAEGSVTLVIDGKSYTVSGSFATDGAYGVFIPD